MTFGEKLKALRETQNMTQDDLAAKLYVSRTAVSKWETNRSYPSIDTLKTIQELFDVSIDDLISNEDVNGSLVARQRESRKFYWYAIGCFALAILFCIISVFVYNAGFVEWVIPLRVIAIIGVIGYLAFAMASKTRYQPKPPIKRSWKRYWASRLILLLVVAGAMVMFVIQATE